MRRSARSHVVPSVKRKEGKRCGGRSAEGREGGGGGDGAWRERERRNWVRHQGSEAAPRCPAPRTPPALVTATPPRAGALAPLYGRHVTDLYLKWVCGEGCARRFGWEVESGVVAQTRRPRPPLPCLHTNVPLVSGERLGWALLLTCVQYTVDNRRSCSYRYKIDVNRQVTA